MNGKEIAKVCILTLLLIPLVVFWSGMASGLLADPIVARKVYHRPKDVGQEIVMAAMTMSLVAGVGLAVALAPLAHVPPRILPPWAAVIIGLAMLGFILFGNKLYHDPGGTVASLFLMIFLLTAPLPVAAGFIFRITRARQPTGKSLIQPLLWAFGSILATSVCLALVTVLIGGIPLAEMPTR